VEGSFRTSNETQHDDGRTMGRIEEEEMWFVEGLRMGRIEGKGSLPYNCTWHHMSYERCLIRQLQWIFGLG